jgi:hypothetical protein
MNESQEQNMERFTILRVILAQGPCSSSLYRSNFNICATEVAQFHLEQTLASITDAHIAHVFSLEKRKFSAHIIRNI